MQMEAGPVVQHVMKLAIEEARAIKQTKGWPHRSVRDWGNGEGRGNRALFAGTFSMSFRWLCPWKK